jgi:hypothetical protein
MEIVDICVNRRTIARALLHDDCLEPALTPRGTRPPHPDVRKRCGHARRSEAFAYRRSRDEHWPISYCEDCQTVLAGHDPHVRLKRARWKLDPQNAAAARWAREWPKRGRPRTGRPPESVAWPDAA